MKTIPAGLGMLLWKIKDVAKGNVADIAAEGESLHLSWCALKICNGTSAYNLRLSLTGYKDDYIPALCAALRTRNIRPVGWGYVYGDNPAGEAQIAIERVKRFNLEAYLIDAEGEYKQPGKREAAKRYMAALRAGLPDLPIGLCSYRWPSYHPELPWAEFLAGCDFHAPQVYWVEAHNPRQQLEQSIRELSKLKKLPVLPVGAAYHENGWQPLPGEVTAFYRAAKELGLPGLSWWEWGHVERYGFLPALQAMTWDAIPPQPVLDLDQRVSAIEREARNRGWNV